MSAYTKNYSRCVKTTDIVDKNYEFEDIKLYHELVKILNQEKLKGHNNICKRKCEFDEFDQILKVNKVSSSNELLNLPSEDSMRENDLNIFKDILYLISGMPESGSNINILDWKTHL